MDCPIMILHFDSHRESDIYGEPRIPPIYVTCLYPHA